MVNQKEAIFDEVRKGGSWRFYTLRFKSDKIIFLDTIDAMIHEHICHPKIVHKPSLASTAHTLKASEKNGDDSSKHSNKHADKKHHRSSIKRFQTSVKKSRPQTLV